MRNFNLEIGNLAGNIWEYLDEFGSISTFKLKMAMATSNSNIYLALGWLLRENKIKIEALDKGYRVSKI